MSQYGQLLRSWGSAGRHVMYKALPSCLSPCLTWLIARLVSAFGLVSQHRAATKPGRSPCFLVAPATHRKRRLPGSYLRYCFAATIQVSRRPFNTRMDGDIDSSQQSLCANDPNLPDNKGKCEIQREPRTSTTSVRLRLRGSGRMLLSRRPGLRPSLISQCKVHVPHSRIWKSRM